VCVINIVGLNSVHHEILSSVIIVFYDKVRGRNKAQRWILLVCWGFFIWKRYNRTQFHRTLLCLTLLIDNVLITSLIPILLFEYFKEKSWLTSKVRLLIFQLPITEVSL